MITKQIVTKKLNVETSETFVRSIQSGSSYYVFAARHTPYANGDVIIPMPSDTTKEQINIYNDMIFGKKIKYNDVTNMIRRYDWAVDTVYDMYDDADANLIDKKFYVAVNSGTYTYVYKCLFNNNGAKSTVEPYGTDTDAFETPNDGYIWKYMFSVDEYTMNKFSTIDYMPVVIDSKVTASAKSGAIDVISITDAGKGYDNYIPEGEFESVRIDENTLLYGIGLSASSLNNFYNGCIIKITSGEANGQYRVIINYQIDVENNKKIITLENSFNGTVKVGDTYEIYPNVFIYDTSGTKITDCYARAIIDPTSGNSIGKVEILNSGSGYRSAIASIQVNDIVPVTIEASLRAILSPEGGHGISINNELFAKYVGINTYFIGNEIPLSIANDYRTIGLIKDPLFANVSILLDMTKTIGQFIIGENVYRYKPIKLAGTVNVAANNSIYSSGVNFEEALRTNDQIIINDGSSNFFATISSISSNSIMTVSSSSNFTGSNCSITLAETELYGKVSSYSFNSLNLTNVLAKNLSIGSNIIGQDSFCTAAANTIARPFVFINERDADEFSGFNQLTKFVGSVSKAGFIDDEIIAQEAVTGFAQPQASFHSIIDSVGGLDDTMYVTNVKNSFLTASYGSDGTIKGLTSNSYFIVSNKYDGELIIDSGEILYLENLNPITRKANQTEVVKLVLEF
jgi:hypothetical protein